MCTFYDKILFCILPSLHILSFRILRVGGNKFTKVHVEMGLIQENTFLIVKVWTFVVSLKQITNLITVYMQPDDVFLDV